MEVKNEQNVFLEMAKDDLKLRVSERLKYAKVFLSQDISTKDEQKEWWDSFIGWDSYNIDLIKHAFNIYDNIYAKIYKRSSGIGGIITSSNYKKTTFQESVESNREEMRFQVKKLERFRETIDLFKVSDTSSEPNEQKDKLTQLLNLLSRFHKIAQELRSRRKEREPLIIKDEYDIHYLLNSLLHLYFDDIRQEDFSPSNAGSNSRIDFVLKKEKIVLEVKISSERLGAKDLGKELLIDIGRYKEYPYCNDLVIFIYDRNDNIRNKQGFKNDLEKQSTNKLRVTVIINPYY